MSLGEPRCRATASSAPGMIIDSLVDLFSADATVVDEGEARRGIAESRAWQIGPASKYTYTTQILDTVALEPDRYVVTGRLTGDFPSGSADLKWDFTVAGGRTSPARHRTVNAAAPIA